MFSGLGSREFKFIMAFKFRSISVSHFGLPSGLDTTEDVELYLEDVDVERAELEKAWLNYRTSHSIDTKDYEVYQNTLDRLELLKSEAQRRLNARGDLTMTGKWHTRRDSNS